MLVQEEVEKNGGREGRGERENEGSGTNGKEGKERKGKGRKAVSSIPSKENSSKENRKEGTCARI